MSEAKTKVIEFTRDDGSVLRVELRRPIGSMDPKADEFLRFSSKRMAMEQAPGLVKDPADDGTREMLECVTSDVNELRQHLDDYPMDAGDLFSAMTELAGYHAVQDAPELVTEDAKAKFHRRAFGVKAGNYSTLVRPLSGAEYARFIQRNGGSLRPLKAEAMAWAAWSCVQESPDKDKRKPLFEQALADTPFLAQYIGFCLIGMAGSRVSEREKK